MTVSLPAFAAAAPTLARTLAAEYLTAPAAIPTAAELATLRAWIRAEFARIPCPVAFQDADFDLPAAVDRLAADGVLVISTANIGHPWLTSAENAMFRAVHDSHHIAIGADSTLNGEAATFAHACATAPVLIHWMLRSEIVLQAAACIATGEFQPQKFVR